MKNYKFKIRTGLIITTQNDKAKISYVLTNPLSGNTVRFDAKAYLVLRHFNGKREIPEVQRHLRERHALNLSLTALESYVDLFLDLYLFDHNCLDLYWERLDNLKKGILAEELEDLAEEWEKFFPQGLPFVEEMVLSEVIESLKAKDVLKAIGYLFDALRLNPQNSLAKEILEKIEKKIVDIGTRPKVFVMAEELKDKALELKYTSALGIILLVGIILSQVLFFFQRPNLVKLNDAHLNIIKTASETLLQAKLETL
ncbi:MAG: hypothetical protein NC834_05100 [Candidatus Omnitrophica bacterium]|nr:hypothetical protein [Candidatus Omnitrophota bacterium]